MFEEIKQAYERMRMAIVDFNALWPDLVVEGVVWELPLILNTPPADQVGEGADARTQAKVIRVTRHEGKAAIDLAKQALLTFNLDLGQKAGTVMRLPGVFYLRESVLPQVEQINALKKAVDDAIEEVRLELNQVTKARGRIMRNALGSRMNTNQLLRTIQAFEGEPRLVVFTWAGHTKGNEYVPVRQVRENLQAQAEKQARELELAVGATPADKDLRSLLQMADNGVLLKRKAIAPHPRAMFYFSESTRYEAMIHANLPAFVLAGAGAHKIHGLRDFNSADRVDQRSDEDTSRTEALAGQEIYVPKKRTRTLTRSKLEVPATYGAGADE